MVRDSNKLLSQIAYIQTQFYFESVYEFCLFQITSCAQNKYLCHYYQRVVSVYTPTIQKKHMTRRIFIYEYNIIVYNMRNIYIYRVYIFLTSSYIVFCINQYYIYFGSKYCKCYMTFKSGFGCGSYIYIYILFVHINNLTYSCIHKFGIYTRVLCWHARIFS